MSANNNLIQSSRLDLVLLDADALRHSLAGDIEALTQALNLSVPADWFGRTKLMKLRLDQIIRDPEFQPWSIRAMAVRQTAQMVGHIGFHTRPGAAYLHSFAPDGIEFGYSVFPAFRRLGYAREASVALMEWAYRLHSISQYVLTIDPDNIPSLKLALSLGFTKVGSHIDEVDGVEDIYRLDYSNLHLANGTTARVGSSLHKENK